MAQEAGQTRRSAPRLGAEVMLRALPYLAGAMPALAAGGVIWLANSGQPLMMQAVAGAVCVAAAAGLALFIRNRTRGVGLVIDALDSFGQGERSPDALRVNAAAGARATAFNAMLEELRVQHRRGVVERLAEGAFKPARRGEDLSTACDGLWVGMLVIDGQLRVRYANGAAAILLSAVREKMIGSEVSQSIADQAVVTAVTAAAHGQARVRQVVECAGASGSDTVLRFAVRTIGSGEHCLAMVLVEDVTQQRIADRSRNAFVAQATHELRTPLTNMRLCLDELIESPKMDEAARANYVNIVSQESRRLERMVGDMLSISEIEAGTLALHAGEVRTSQMFQELQRDFEVQAKDKNTRLVFNLPPKLPLLMADRDKLVMCVSNLLGNALKYTPDGGEVNVNVRATSTTLVVDVADTGIGIAPEEAEKVFDRFYRSKDQRVEKITGTGLGLALARQVARLHGGDITLASQLNKGSTFTLSVPLTPGSSQPSAIKPASGGTAAAA